MGHVLEVDNIVKQYGKSKKNSGAATLALAGASFFVDAGEFVAIMGPSGSGKSTLLNCISTIDAPTSGSIRVAGRDVTKMRGESSRNSAATNSALYFKTRICSIPSPCARISRSRSRFKRNQRARYLPWSTKSRRGWALQRFWSNIPTKSRAAKNNAPQQRARSSRSQASFWPMSPQVHSTQNRPNSCSKRFQRSTAWARRSSW